MFFHLPGMYIPYYSIVFDAIDFIYNFIYAIPLCVYSYIYSQSSKRSEILSLVTTWVNLEGIMLSEISHTEKNSYRMA